MSKGLGFNVLRCALAKSSVLFGGGSEGSRRRRPRRLTEIVVEDYDGGTEVVDGDYDGNGGLD
jgi:hypothetical protein